MKFTLTWTDTRYLAEKHRREAKGCDDMVAMARRRNDIESVAAWQRSAMLEHHQADKWQAIYDALCAVGPRAVQDVP